MIARWIPPTAALLLCLGGPMRADAPSPPAAAAEPVRPAGAKLASTAPTAPAVFRFEPDTAQVVADDFDRAVAAARTALCTELARTLGTGPLPEAVLAEPAFDAVFNDWSAQWRGFPAKPALARTWAQAQDGERWLRPLRDRLVQVTTERKIRESTIDPEAWQGPVEIQLVVRGPDGGELTVAQVAARAQPFRRSQLYSLAQARQEVRDGWPREDWAAARFAAGLIRPNTFSETGLTRTLRRQAPVEAPAAAAAVSAAATFQPAPADQRPVPEPWMQWLLLGAIPAGLGLAALALAARLARESRRPPAPAAPDLAFPRLASLEQRLTHPEPHRRPELSRLRLDHDSGLLHQGASHR